MLRYYWIWTEVCGDSPVALPLLSVFVTRFLHFTHCLPTDMNNISSSKNLHLNNNHKTKGTNEKNKTLFHRKTEENTQS